MSGEGSPDKSDVLDKVSNIGSNRRSFLKSSGALIGGVPTLAASSAEAAEATELRQLVKKYEKQSAVRKAVRSSASELIRELHREGLIEDKSINSLINKPLLTGDAVTSIDSGDRDEGVIVSGHYRGDKPTANIIVVERYDDRTVRIVVEPEFTKSTAVVDWDSGEREFVETDGQSTEDASTDEITTQGTCGDYFWFGDCYRNPGDDCSCTEDDPCGCYQVEVRCCERGCDVIGYRYGNCATTLSGCCSYFSCSDAC